MIETSYEVIRLVGFRTLVHLIIFSPCMVGNGHPIWHRATAHPRSVSATIDVEMLPLHSANLTAMDILSFSSLSVDSAVAVLYGLSDTEFSLILHGIRKSFCIAVRINSSLPSFFIPSICHRYVHE